MTPVALDAVLKTAEIAKRPFRPPDYEGESRALVELARELGTSPRTILQRLVDVALVLCRADSAGVSLLDAGVDPAVFRWQARSGRIAPYAWEPMAPADSPCGTVVEHDATALFSHPERHFPLPEAPDAPIVEALFVPFHAAGAPVGTVCVIAHTDERRFDSEDVRLLSSLSRFVSGAHRQNAALDAEKSARRAVEEKVRRRTRQLADLDGALRRSEERLERELESMRRLQEVSTQLIEADDIGTLYERILDTAMGIMRSDFSSIQRLDASRGAIGELQLLGHRGFDPKAAAFWEWVRPASDCTCGIALRTGRRVVVPDVLACAEIAGSEDLAHYRLTGIRAVQSTPLLSRSEGNVIGMISTHWRDVHEPTPADLHLMDVLARQAADLIERKLGEDNLARAKRDLEARVEDRTAELTRTVDRLRRRSEQLRALTGEITLVEQRERKRLAQMLHDHVQQSLGGAKYRLSVVRADGPPEVESATAAIEDLLDDCLNTARAITAELSPAVLHEAGLAKGLGWLSRWMPQRYGLTVTVEGTDCIPPLPEDLSLLLFESVRELLLNVVKHSGAHAALLDVRPGRGTELRITVSDTGRGFDPAAVRPGAPDQGIGLFGIRERIEFVGGQVIVDAAHDSGSSISLVVPVAERPQRGAIEAPVPLTERRLVRYEAPQLPARIRVLIVDDHPVMREGLSLLLSRHADMEIIGHAADGHSAIELTRELAPQVVLMDVSMPGLDGIEASRVISRELPHVRIIGLSLFDDADRARSMLDAGAFRYLSKTGASSDLLAAIRDGVRLH